MQLSGLINIGLSFNKAEIIRVNFIPDLFTNALELKEYLLKKNEYNINRSISEHLDNLLNYKLTNMFIKEVKLTGYEQLDEIDDHILTKLCELITDYYFVAIGTNDYIDSQVCSGGIDLNEVNMQTMESKIIPGLYFAGEVLDVDGECGGYNLGFAFISGLIAGTKAGE